MSDDDHYHDLFKKAVKEKIRNKRIAHYNQTATLSQLAPFENKAQLAFFVYTIALLRGPIGRNKNA